LIAFRLLIAAIDAFAMTAILLSHYFALRHGLMPPPYADSFLHYASLRRRHYFSFFHCHSIFDAIIIFIDISFRLFSHCHFLRHFIAAAIC
jgi:hypothetical protein